MTNASKRADASRESFGIGLPTASFLPTLGGAEVCLHNIAARLVLRGHRPVVFAPPRSWWGLMRERRSLPYTVVPLPPKQASILKRMPRLSLFAMDRYFRLMEKHYSIDIWHATMGFPVGIMAAHYGVAAAPPVVVQCVGEDIQIAPEVGYGARCDPRADRLVRRWLPKASALVAISESVAAEYEDISIPDARIARIPNGVDVDRFSRDVDRARVRKRYGIGDDEVLVLSVGRYHAKKNFEGLVRAFSLARERSAQPARLVLAGSGLRRLMPLVREHGLEAHVIITEEAAQRPAGADLGAVPPDTLVDLYRAADVFAFLSRIETFGIVLVEAMAAGLPIVTTDAPGCRDVIRHGEDGMMVAAGNHETAARALQSMIDEPARRRSYAEKSRCRAQDFSWDKVVDLYLDLYRTLLAA